jgi:hypothetical protein
MRPLTPEGIRGCVTWILLSLVATSIGAGLGGMVLVARAVLAAF